MKPEKIFENIYLIDGRIATLNLAPGRKVYGEELIKIGNDEYRVWDPYRSKLSAAIKKELKIVPIKEGSTVLYLGAAHGTTVSHVSDIIGRNGIIYAVEFSDRCFNELLTVIEKRRNIVAICEDARRPELYKNKVLEKVDVVYCDIAQRDQTEIAIRNCKMFLKPNGYLMLAIKTQSIDVTKPAKTIVSDEISKLKEAGFEIIDWKMLDPFEEKHAMVISRM